MVKFVTLLPFVLGAVAVWAQGDLLKLLEAMKVALPQKDLTKYKTSESHLDWQKVAFNSYTAEMCKQKWQEVSKEVRLLFFLSFLPPPLLSLTSDASFGRARFYMSCFFSAKQIRKFRTLTELIVDAQDYIKNPYKGKKIKVRWGRCLAYCSVNGARGSCFVFVFLLLPSTETPRFPQETPDSVLSLLHGKEGQIRQTASWDEQPRPHQDPLKEVQGAAWQKEGQSTKNCSSAGSSLEVNNKTKNLVCFCHDYRRSMWRTSYEIRSRLCRAWWSSGEITSWSFY